MHFKKEKNNSKYLAFDFGAESGRGTVGILKNGKLELIEVHRFPNKLMHIFDNLHWDVHYLFDEMLTGIKKATKHDSNINGIAVDTWGVDFGLVTKNNQLLGAPFAYRDSRTNGILEKAFKLIPSEELYSLTGIQFMQFNSVFQLLSMVESKNLLLDFANKLLFMPDLLNFFLTGIIKSEYTIATTSQLLNASNKSWDNKIFSKLSIPIKLMPELIFPGTKIGSLHPSIAKRLKIDRLNVFSVGSHDTASAVAAVPNLEKNWAFISSGTWSLIGIETDTPIINETSFKYNFTNEGGVCGKIRFLRNVMGMWIIQQIKKEWEKSGESYTYSEISILAEKALPFKCIIDTDADDFLNPESMIVAINNYCKRTKQEIPNNKGEYIRSVLESLAFKYKTIIDVLNIVGKEEIKTINIVGGGSQNELLNQLTADATGLEVVAGPVEATTYGNIIVQAIADKKINDLVTGRKIISDSINVKIFEPVQNKEWKSQIKKMKDIINRFDK